MRTRQAATVLLLGAALLVFAPAASGADVSKLPQARYDDPTNTFHVIDSCGDGLGSELRYRIGSGSLNLRRVSECGRSSARFVGAPEDAPLLWRVCSGTVCSPWHQEDV